MPQSVVVAASLRDYFLEAVSIALAELALRPDRATESYLVDLLCANATNPDLGLRQALALMLVEAQRDLPGQSLQQLKQVGDQSLYVVGFFGDSLRRAQLDPAYYVLLGKAAYRRLSRVARRLEAHRHLVVVYAELGQQFGCFVEVLAEVREQSGPSPSGDIGELYERWLHTGRQATARRLVAAGVALHKKPGTPQ
jgi:hypothetical protein